jgi:hypothetical protein
MKSKIVEECICDIDTKRNIGRSRDGNWVLVAVDEFIDCDIEKILQTYRHNKLTEVVNEMREIYKRNDPIQLE